MCLEYSAQSRSEAGQMRQMVFVLSFKSLLQNNVNPITDGVLHSSKKVFANDKQGSHLCKQRKAFPQRNFLQISLNCSGNFP